MVSRFLVGLLFFTSEIREAAAEDSSFPQEAALTKRIEELERSLRELKDQIKKEKPLKAKSQPSQKRQIKVTAFPSPSKNSPSHSTPIPPTPAEFSYKVGGRIKLDAYYDAGARGPLYGLDPSILPLKGIDNAANNRGHFNTGVSSSRLFGEVEKTVE